MKDAKIFIGYIVNNNSPYLDGRVQVRIPTLHPDNSQGFEVVNDQDLPWLEYISQGHLQNEIGFSVIPEIGQGVHVLVPENLDDMLVLGQVRSSDTTFNQYSKGEGSRTLEDFEASHKSVDIEEPEDLNPKTEYPYGNSYFSHSGHLLMQDDTPENERVLIQHRTGQLLEFRPDGSYELRVPEDGYYIVEGDLNEQIEGAVNRYIGGQLSIQVKEQVLYEVSKAFDVEQDGSITLKSEKNITLEQGGEVKITQGDNIAIKGTQIHLN